MLMFVCCFFWFIQTNNKLVFLSLFLILQLTQCFTMVTRYSIMVYCLVLGLSAGGFLLRTTLRICFVVSVSTYNWETLSVFHRSLPHVNSE